MQARNVTFSKTLHAVYFKTWTGEQVNYPPNGGGGGLGCAFFSSEDPERWMMIVLTGFADASDMVFEDLKATALRGPAIAISQCTTFSGTAGNCTSSKFQLRDLSFKDLTGTTTSHDVASFQCSAVKPCENISTTGVDLALSSNGTLADEYLCGHVEGTRGFNCTGAVCVGGSATGGC